MLQRLKSWIISAALAAVLALGASPAHAAQATYSMPLAGPMSFTTFLGTWLNPALTAIISNNSGATAPAVTGQPATYQWWVDTSTTPRVLKLYDGTNWLSVAKIDASGHLWTVLGSAINLTGTTSGTVIITPQATAGTPTLTLPTTTGTFAVSATSPIVLSATTGVLTCPTCTTSSGGGAVTGTAPVAVSGAGVVSITGSAGQVLAGSSPAFTATPVLGVAGATVGTLGFQNATSGTITVSPPTGALGTVTLSLPAATDTLVGKATTDTLTNKTFDTAGTGNSFSIAGVAVTANTGTGAVARATSPTFVTPILGVAAATSINKVAITAPATGSTLTIADGKTLTASNSITIAGTDSTVMTFPSTTATIARTDAGQTFTGVQTMTSPALTTPDISGVSTGSGVATAATASTLVLRDANANSSANNFIQGYATTPTAAGTTTLTAASAGTQNFTGSTTQTVVLPVTSTLVLGHSYTVTNQSSGAVTVNSSGGNLVLAIAAGNTGIFTAVSTSGTTAASWQATYISSGAGTGTVTSVSCGTGLTGGTITTVGTCNVDLGVTVQAYNATLAAVAADPSILASQQIARNGSMAIAQRSMPTADNTYSLDGWRLEIENANGVVITQDTADVPTGAGYAAKLVVGSGNNGKFGLFSPIENKDMLKLRSGVASLLVPLKATAGLTDGTGKIRICLAQWTGTADSVASDPVTTWGAEGTNPTLSGSWSCANTPAAISVTTSWADYKVENVSISGSATNVGIFVWSDDRATTTTTDILRIGGKVTLTQGAAAAAPIVLRYAEEQLRSRWCYRNLSEPPLRGVVTGSTTVNRLAMPISPPMRVSPTIALTGSINVYDGVAISTVTSISTNYGSSERIEFDGSGASGLTAGRPAVAYSAGGWSIQLDGDL